MKFMNTDELGHFGPLGPVVSTAVRIANRIKRRRQLMGLLDLPDYILKDIGLQRDQISREGLTWFWED